ncbi:MAG TPA: citrate lyase subunit alpha, partial [Phycisphaerae bacterium]|nr:citrate lyase subunit alpha [Phycisphaerae bacterium]
MSHNVELVKNAAGRMVPTIVNGQPQAPFQGVGKYKPTGRKAAPPVRSSNDYPRDGNKVVADVRKMSGDAERNRIEAIKIALQKAGIRDGMRISSHHHFRNGDKIAVPMFFAAAELGVKDLIWFPSACFPCHAPLIPLIESGVIHHIEGSMNGPLGDYCSSGKMRGHGVLRSHGGRWQCVQDGEVHIDIAVLAAPTCDPFGDSNGVTGPSACGGLGFGLVDSMYADHVIMVTDNLTPFPCVPWQIQGN